MKRLFSLLFSLYFSFLLAGCGKDQSKVIGRDDPTDDDNRTIESSEPEAPSGNEPDPSDVVENNTSAPLPEEPGELENLEPETDSEPVEPKKPEPKADRHLDPDLVGELADALQKLPDFSDKKVLKELLAEAVDQQEVQSRSEGGKQRYYQDDLSLVGWVKQMRGNTNSPISLGFYLNGIRSGPWATWTGGRRLRGVVTVRVGAALCLASLY